MEAYKQSSEQDQAVELLERLHILSNIHDPGQQRAYRLSKPFVSSLRLALTGGGNHRSFGVACDTPAKDKVDIKFLDNFARSQWEGILYFIVGSAGTASAQNVTITQSSKTLLEIGEFVTRGRTAEITQAGFEFLLQEVNAQVWSLLIVYLDNAEAVS